MQFANDQAEYELSAEPASLESKKEPLPSPPQPPPQLAVVEPPPPPTVDTPKDAPKAEEASKVGETPKVEISKAEVAPKAEVKVEEVPKETVHVVEAPKAQESTTAVSTTEASSA